jgi:hypothetical protein
MWCANCRSDVAAEVSTDNRHVNCANCGGPIATPLSGRTLTRTQQARELLERWSRDRAPEPAAATAEAAKSHFPAAPSRPAAVYAIKQDDASPLETAKPRHRFDGGHPPGESPGRNRDFGRAASAAADAADLESGPPQRGVERRHDAGHPIAGPHVTIPAKPPTKWVPLVGQSLAYVGVLGLMAGACLVILGYFRGPASYAPTGWLITMAGQMLLFLGVVTLVSTGMEETTNTVASHIDRINEKLLRIEQATTQLRGPSGGTSTADDAAAARTPQREISRAG